MRMKRFLAMEIFSTILTLLAAGCSWADTEKDKADASLRFKFENHVTKTLSESDFTLKIVNSEGDSLWIGKLSERPEEIKVKAGIYDITVYSQFKAPGVRAAQFGDSVRISIKKKETATVRLYCTLINSGISLSFSQDFIEEHPEGVTLAQGSARIPYPYDQNEVVYFPPGDIYLLYNNQVLVQRSLISGQIRHFHLDVTLDKGSMGISVIVSPEPDPVDEILIVDPRPFSIFQMQGISDSLKVEVKGYIVGACKNGKFVAFSNPGFDVSSNILIADSPYETELEHCAPIELTSNWKKLYNLVDNPARAQTCIAVHGTILPYFGLKGIKKITSISDIES